MIAPKKSECTAEEWAHLQRERAAYRGIETHLRKAIALSLTLYGRDYSETYIDGTLRRIWSEQPKLEPTHKTYIKAAIPRSLAKKVFERDGYRCVECGDWHDLCVDHIIPESKGGPLTLENSQTLCRPCNTRKGARL